MRNTSQSKKKAATDQIFSEPFVTPAPKRQQATVTHYVLKNKRKVSHKRFAHVLSARLVKEKSLTNRNAELSRAYDLIENDPAINLEAKEWASKRNLSKRVTKKKMLNRNNKNLDMVLKSYEEIDASVLDFVCHDGKVTIKYKGVAGEYFLFSHGIILIYVQYYIAFNTISSCSPKLLYHGLNIKWFRIAENKSYRCQLPATRLESIFNSVIEIPMFKFSNTNMPIESFHNLLKTKFFKKKVNRRVDRLIYTLVVTSQSHNIKKERFNVHEMNEMNGKSRKKCELESETEKSRLIPMSSIIKKSDEIFEAKSASEPSIYHIVDIENNNC